MPEGTIVKFNEAKGSGWVQPDEGTKKLFAHRDYLKNKTGKPMAVGKRVRFVVARGYMGSKAKDIEVL